MTDAAKAHGSWGRRVRSRARRHTGLPIQGAHYSDAHAPPHNHTTHSYARRPHQRLFSPRTPPRNTIRPHHTALHTSAAADREQGTWRGDSNGAQHTADGEVTGNRRQGTGDRRQGTGDGGQGRSGDRGQGPKDKAQGTSVGDRHRGQYTAGHKAQSTGGSAQGSGGGSRVQGTAPLGPSRTAQARTCRKGRTLITRACTPRTTDIYSLHSLCFRFSKIAYCNGTRDIYHQP